MFVTSGKPSGSIKHMLADGYEIYCKEDEIDYLALCNLLRDNKLDKVTVIKKTDIRDVYLLEEGGRKFILKCDRYVPKKLEAKIWNFLRGPFYVRKMASIYKASRLGCRVTPEFLLVALRKGLFFPVESFALQEYVDGIELEDAGSPEEYKDEIIQAFSELHKYNLALGDVNTSNIMVTPQGIKIIDLTWNGTRLAGKGQDIVRLKNRLGIIFPVNSIGQWIGVIYITVKHGIREFLHTLRYAEHKDS